MKRGNHRRTRSTLPEDLNKMLIVGNNDSTSVVGTSPAQGLNFYPEEDSKSTHFSTHATHGGIVGTST